MMDMAEYVSRRLQQPAHVNFEQFKKGLKVIFCFLNPNGDEDGDDGEPGAWPDLAR